MTGAAPSLQPAPAVRRLGPGEVATFRALRLSAMSQSPASFNTTHDEECAKPDAWYRDRLASDGVFIAEDAGAPVGLVGFSRYGSVKARHKGFIYGLFVDPAARRSGIGRALVQSALNHAAREVEIVLLTVVTTNQPAIRLYETMGFERYGLEPAAMKTAEGSYCDDLLMACRLR